jgi:hypothetical protein
MENQTAGQSVPETKFGFTVGQRVYIPRTGQKGVVTGFSSEFGDDFVRVKRDGVTSEMKDGGGWFPESLTWEPPVQTPAPTNPETKFGFTVGQRVVIAGHYRGVITGFTDHYVKVHRDGWNIGQDFSQWYPSSVKLEAGSPVAPTAASTPAPLPNLREKAYDVAKRIAKKLGQEQHRVTADNVQSELARLGYTSVDLGNAAGNLFRGKNWKHSGYVTTARPTGRGRKISVWEYMGAVAKPALGPVTPLLPGSKYIVETKTFNSWKRSLNSTVNGERLDVHEFDTFEEANKEAIRQETTSGRAYRAVEYRKPPVITPAPHQPIVTVTPILTPAIPQIEVTAGSVRVGDLVAIGPRVQTALLKSAGNPDGVSIGERGEVIGIYSTAPYPVEIKTSARGKDVYKYHELVHV